MYFLVGKGGELARVLFFSQRINDRAIGGRRVTAQGSGRVDQQPCWRGRVLGPFDIVRFVNASTFVV